MCEELPLVENPRRKITVELPSSDPWWCSIRRYRYPRQYHLRLRILGKYSGDNGSKGFESRSRKGSANSGASRKQKSADVLNGVETKPSFFKPAAQKSKMISRGS